MNPQEEAYEKAIIAYCDSCKAAEETALEVMKYRRAMVDTTALEEDALHRLDLIIRQMAVCMTNMSKANLAAAQARDRICTTK